MKSPALFLDRDGTIIEDVGYLSDPKQVRLLPGAAEAIRGASKAGYLTVVVSNQSGVARGLFDEDVLAEVHSQMESLLATRGVQLDGAYYCPYLDGDGAKVSAYRCDSDLRKPAPGMLLQAARELDIDLERSWIIGDSETDIEAGTNAGCRTILLNGKQTDGGAAIGTKATHVASDLREAVGLIEPVERGGPSPKRRSMAQTTINQDGDQGDATPVGILTKIHEQIERAQRREKQHDFSGLRLFGALLQMFAVVAVLWGVSSLFDDQFPAATARLALACFFQLASISSFAIDRFR